MRVTNNMMTNMLLHNLNRNMYNMSRLQEQGTDGKRIHRPSDDPIAISKILKFKTDLSDLHQYESNIKDALSWYQITETSVEDMSAAVNRIRDLAVQAANTGSNSPDDLKKIKAEISQLREHIVSSGNFNYAGKYIFSGYQNDKPLFRIDEINGKRIVRYNVDITNRDVARPQKMKYEVGQAEHIQVTTNGLELYGIMNPEDKKFKFRANFDPNQDYSAKDIVLDVGGEKYTIKTKDTKDGVSTPIPLTNKAEIEKAFKDATNSKGRKLSSLTHISFDGGKLTIESRAFDNKRISLDAPIPAGISNIDTDFKYNHNVYGKMYTDSTGTSFDEGISAIQTRFDRTRNYTAENMDIKITDKDGNEVTFKVDENLLNGNQIPLDRALIVERYKNAGTPAGSPPWAGTKLGDVADIYYDEHENLVIKAKHPGFKVEPDDRSGKIKFTESEMGISSKKSQVVGKFELDGPLSDYRTSTLSFTIDGGSASAKTFKVDTSELTGNYFNLKREKVLEEIRKADDGAGHKLEDYADVFFNQEGDLVVKNKEYGTKHSVSANFTPGSPATAASYKPSKIAGVDKVEAKVSFKAFDGFDDQYIKEHEDELKTSPLFISYNGERKEINLDKNAHIETVAEYKKALQDAINKTIGENKIIVGPRVNPADPNAALTGDKFLSFETIHTPDGVIPQVKVEPVVTNTSSLINDIDKFIEALEDYDQEGINQFLGEIDVHLNRVLSVRADIGAKTNRMELAMGRTKDNVLAFTKNLSKVEDVDLAETIMQLKNYENVYRASLSMGSKIIQPSLVDFIR